MSAHGSVKFFRRARVKAVHHPRVGQTNCGHRALTWHLETALHAAQERAQALVLRGQRHFTEATEKAKAAALEIRARGYGRAACAQFPGGHAAIAGGLIERVPD